MSFFLKSFFVVVIGDVFFVIIWILHFFGTFWQRTKIHRMSPRYFLEIQYKETILQKHSLLVKVLRLTQKNTYLSQTKHISTTKGC